MCHPTDAIFLKLIFSHVLRGKDITITQHQKRDEAINKIKWNSYKFDGVKSEMLRFPCGVKNTSDFDTYFRLKQLTTLMTLQGYWWVIDDSDTVKTRIISTVCESASISILATTEYF